ncbi:TspO/MBR family protein [Peribacillus sp. AS_2]|uniref:TspO/MBR family protein n=1 Tax=Peribacillus sp. AS_2 TaxID=2996755 RepID=UPI0022A78272|nr:TspO/MBR family protein [Peribacillus sp. AS_2]MCZ0871082.1 tryptophan-rich sensory protein [Peribacillus sp. AS_2]
MKKEMDCIMNYGKLAKSVLVPVVERSLFATRNSKEIYDKLKKPAFAPPSWTFPIAWTSLYTNMGLLTLITLTAFEFCKIDRISGLAMIPYIAWVTLLFR